MNDTPQWTAKMSVGDEAIDAQHRDLFGLIAVVSELAAEPKLTAADEAVVERTFNALNNYARVHFRDEEGLMAEAGYPNLAEHIEEHRTFTEWLRVLEDARRAPGASLPNMMRHMSGYLASWLVDHILGSDKHYVPYLAGKKPSP